MNVRGQLIKKTNEQLSPPDIIQFRSTVWLGYFIILFAAGIVIVWATVAKIDSAVIAPGTVVLDSRRQVVESLDGGQVSQISVREGQSVEEGELLIIINAEDTKAEVAILTKEFDVAKAAEARIRASLEGATEPKFPDELLSRIDQPDIAALLDDERGKARQWNVTLISQISVLENRKQLFVNESEALSAEKVSVENQIQSLKDELEGLYYLRTKGLVEKFRVLPLERELARNIATISRNRTDLEKALHNIEDLDLQITATRERFKADLIKEMAEIRQKIDGLPKRIDILENKVHRTNIVSPKAGTIQNLKVTTIGQVVRSGELLLEIVPKDDALIVQAEFNPNDAADLINGSDTQIRFPSFRSRLTPTIFGKVVSVSQDRIEPLPPKQPYFLAQIRIDKSTIPNELQNGLKAGISAEVVLPKGERTVLDYLLQPLFDSIRHTFREK